jgi:hypothetical protein
MNNPSEHIMPFGEHGMPWLPNRVLVVSERVT